MIVQRRRRSLFEAVRRALERRAAHLSRSVTSELEELELGAEEHHLADVDDLGGDALEQDTAFALMQLGHEELEQVRWALRRLDEGTYGTCEDCGAEITEERLRALPLATRCVACQRASEGGPAATAREARTARRSEELSERRLASFEGVIEPSDTDEEPVPFRP